MDWADAAYRIDRRLDQLSDVLYMPLLYLLIPLPAVAVAVYAGGRLLDRLESKRMEGSNSTH